MLPLAEDHILNLDPYIPGRPKPDAKIGGPFVDWAKLASNENCLGPSPLAVEAARLALREGHVYPPADPELLKQKVCELYSAFALKPEQVVFGNGSSELITLLVRALLSGRECLLNAWPSFIMYRLAAAAQGAREITIPLDQHYRYDVEGLKRAFLSQDGQCIKMLFIANPNNPTGTYLGREEIDDLLSGVPEDVVVVFDEAYAEYVAEEDYPRGLDYAMVRPRTFVLRTLSKIYGLAGLRIGYGMGDPAIVSLLQRLRDPFSVNRIAQQGALAAFSDHAHVEKSRRHVLLTKPPLVQFLSSLGFRVFEGVGNFVLVERSAGMPSAAMLCQRLLDNGSIVRPLANYDLPNCLRISVGTREENEILFGALEKVL